ncbi:MAG: hypothetical protein HONBIEJF_00907 [Fimbriimonadaceae bacterium]|nr:hypothetical protein [Fimbriimonadaceae bacterium]
MKKTLSLIALATAATTFAQETPDFSPVDVSLRTGVAFPFDNNVSDRSKTLFVIGADMYFSTRFIPNAQTYLSAEWQMSAGSGRRVSIIPITANVRWFTRQDEMSDRRGYFFVGIGAAFVDVFDSKFVLAGRAGLGYEFSPTIFVEGSLLLTDWANGARGSGFGLTVGYRF